MIRFIDIGRQTGNTEEGVKEFCFYNTVTDMFEFFSDECCWTSIQEFRESYTGSNLERYVRLIPDEFNKTTKSQRAQVPIDLDRLHKRPKVGRGSGKTFDLVVEILQNIDFIEPDVLIVCRVPGFHFFSQLLSMFVGIAKSMNYPIAKIDMHPTQIRFESGAVIKFVVPEVDIRGYKYIEFNFS